MKTIAPFAPTRRDFLRKGRLLITTAAVLGPASALAQAKPRKQKRATRNAGEEVSPPEDLMREHGVLSRLLLIYEEVLSRLNKRQDFPPEALGGAASLLRRFIEDYHEKLEEEYLFARFEKRGKLIDLVQVLRQQHQAGRRLTDSIQSSATPSVLKNPEDRSKLEEDLRFFIRMYRPHAAREDTVLFPALRALLSPHEYEALGEEFEEREHALFGAEGFAQVVDAIAKWEKMLDLSDLSQFTPPV